MSPDKLVVIVSIAVAGCVPALCVLAAALRLRAMLARRLQRLEDALRVYNSANAELGRQLRAVEEQLLLLRGRSAAAAEDTSVAAAPDRTRRPAPHAAPRRAFTPASDPDDDYSEAELKLAALLKSRLPALRAGQAQ